MKVLKRKFATYNGFQLGNDRARVAIYDGFTLVELMIVVAIIAVLATAIMLNSGNMTNVGEASVKLANLQALRSAASVYLAESMGDPQAIKNWEKGADGAKSLQEINLLSNYIDSPENAKEVLFGIGLDPVTLTSGYFVGVRLGDLSPEVAEIIVKNKGIIWLVATPTEGKVVGEDTPGAIFGFPGGQAWVKNINNVKTVWINAKQAQNESNIKNVCFFYRVR